MAHTEEISKEYLGLIEKKIYRRIHKRHLNRHLNKNLAGTLLASPAARVTIGESFDVWTLGLERIKPSKRSKQPDLGQLADLADPTELWHHQIRVDGRKAKAFFVHSNRTNHSAKVIVSRLAESIDTT